ncbi:hypothetical protein [Duganella levis]|uniref:DUF4145 domain-containing protein n=1 Tax=Duganella levis TaxID=2692169 RepID=A0ABW9W8B4_9BURK|nr:hypothetical protein [Duganella levis]MYN30231.1 hypothetical protein [Duganella levis]
MTKREEIQKEVEALYQEGTKLAVAFQKKEEKQFQYDYQRWYTKALKVVSVLAPDRHAEFRAYYEIDAKRKSLGYETYVIQDYIKNVVPNKINYPKFDTRSQTLQCFFNQITILNAVSEFIESNLSNIEGQIYSEIQDGGILIARQLLKVSIRAAGALVGVVIEGHLQKVADAHGIKIGKKNPTISDLNEPLKAAAVIDTPTWRKISFLADVRNICSHKKDIEPSKQQVEELIQGAEWLIKNVF